MRAIRQMKRARAFTVAAVAAVAAMTVMTGITAAGGGAAQAQEAAETGAAVMDEAAPFAPDSSLDVLTGAEADRAVARASDWLNGVTGLQGRFLQINPDGSVSEGQFHLLRPGRARFVYDPPSPLSLIADGRTVALVDSALDTVDRAAIDQTPLGWLLKADLDLAADTVIGGVAQQDGLVLISLSDPQGEMGGQLVLIFSAGDSALREWAHIDEFGQETRVILADTTRREQMDPRLFVHDSEPAPARRPGRR